VPKAEEGIINVKATNEVGQMSASARLKVTGLLRKTLKLSRLQCFDTAAVAQWLAVADPGFLERGARREGVGKGWVW